jgi:O-glycosyl hydrolase
MLSSGTQAADFIKVLYPTLQQAGLGSIGITCCDATGWNVQTTMTAQLKSAGVENMISRITSHSYSSNPGTPIDTTRPVWETQYADLDGSFSTTWYSNGALGEGLSWAKLIHNGIVNSNLSAYLYWEGIEDGATNSCLISIVGSTVTPSARLWAFAHWSRYVRPGTVRIGTSGSISGVDLSAFKNTDGSVTIQVINTASASQAISVSTTGGGFTATGVTAYITNNSNNNVAALAASIANGAVSATVPGYSMVTYALTSSTSSALH